MNLRDYWNPSLADLRPGWEALIQWDRSVDGAEVGRLTSSGTTYVGYAKDREAVTGQIREQARRHLADLH